MEGTSGLLRVLDRRRAWRARSRLEYFPRRVRDRKSERPKQDRPSRAERSTFGNVQLPAIGRSGPVVPSAGGRGDGGGGGPARSIGSSGLLVSSAGWRGDGGGCGPLGPLHRELGTARLIGGVARRWRRRPIPAPGISLCSVYAMHRELGADSAVGGEGRSMRRRTAARPMHAAPMQC